MVTPSPKSVLLSVWLTLAWAATSAWAGSTNWTINLNNTTGTFSASESLYSTTLAGSFTRPATGYTMLTVSAATGAKAPAVSTTITAVEVPGLALFTAPIETNETQVVNLVDQAVSGGCPTSNYNAIFVFTEWDQNGRNDFQSLYQPAFGTFSWNAATSTGTVSNVFNPVNGSAISNFSSFNVSGTCAGGQIPIAGVGDRGGTLYMSEEGGAVFRTNGNKAILVMPQGQLVNAAQLTGDYAAYYFQTGIYGGQVGTNGVPGAIIGQTFRMTVNNWATSVTGSTVNPLTGSTTGGSASFTITQVDTPVNGFIKGVLTQNSETGNFYCGVYLTSRNVLFCTGQTPGAPAYPMNMILVGDPKNFTLPIGITNGIVETVFPATDSANLGKFYAVGSMTYFNGSSARSIVRLNADGNIDPTWGWTGNGLNAEVVYGIVANDSANLGKVYVGGSFSYYDGIYTGGIVRLLTNGAYDSTFNNGGVQGPNGNVYGVAICSDSANLGKLYIGGDFNYYGSLTSSALARVKVDGTLDTTFASQVKFGDTVFVITPVTDSPNLGKIYVAGELSLYGSTSVHNLIRLGSDGSLDTAFVANLGTGFNGDVFAVEPALDQQNTGKVYVGGAFFNVNGVSRDFVARLNSNGSLDTSFVPASLNINVLALMAARDRANLGKVYVAGRFTTVNGVTQHFVTRLNANGTVDSAFLPPSYPQLFNGGIAGMAPALDSQNLGRMMLVGTFDRLGSSHIGPMVVLRTDGSVDPAFVPNPEPGNSFDVQVDHVAPAVDSPNLGRIYAVGNFISYNDVPINSYLARLNETGTVDNTFNVGGTGFDNRIDALLPSKILLGRVYAGGEFSYYNGQSARGMVRFLPNGNFDSTFAMTGQGIWGSVESLSEIQTGPLAGRLYVGGYFWTFPNYSQQMLVRLLSNGALDQSFVQTGTGFDSEVATIADAVDSPNLGKIYVGGFFTNYNGASVRFMARMLSTGAIDSSFHVPATAFSLSYAPDPFVETIAPAIDSPNLGKVYVGGFFDGYNGVTRRNIVRLYSDGSLDTTFLGSNLGFNDEVSVIVAAPTPHLGAIYVGGYFSSFNNQYKTYLTRLLTDGSVDPTFNIGLGPNDAVFDIRLITDPTMPGRIYVGGAFSSMNETNYGQFIMRLLDTGAIN